jgi:hypothetical protein
LAENGKKGIFRPKIRTWTTMPLKVGIFLGVDYDLLIQTQFPELE